MHLQIKYRLMEFQPSFNANFIRIHRSSSKFKYPKTITIQEHIIFMVIKSPLVRRKKSRRFAKQIYYSKLGPIGMQLLDF